jgi:hypothetical protein
MFSTRPFQVPRLTGDWGQDGPILLRVLTDYFRGLEHPGAVAVTIEQISNLGAGVENFLETPSSANLSAALTDETGTGSAVFATSPTFAGTLKHSGGTFAVYDTTQNRNAGIRTEVAGALINYGVNDDSGNRFGGTYTSADQGGFLRFDTRSGETLLSVFTRDAGSTSGVARKLGMASDGRLFGTALHNNANAVTGTTNQYIASGTYTPTFTNVANVDGFTARQAQWIRVGNVVTVSGQVTIDYTTANTATAFGVSLPIASDFADQYDAAGVAVSTTASLAGTRAPFSISADSTNNRVEVGGETLTASSNMVVAFTFTYEIL